jgi:outer membrane protein TolC
VLAPKHPSQEAAQRSFYTAEDSLVQSTAALDVDAVSLYKALGGGWEANDPVKNAS